MADTRYGMLIKTNRCVGCQTCIIGCKILHECPTGVYLGYLETVGSSDNYMVSGTFPDVSIRFRPHLCNHCSNPACIPACPTGAMHQRPDGVVMSDSDVCIGCESCRKACPYDAPILNPVAGVINKCDFCIDRVENGKEPLCVCSCPAEARVFGNLNDSQSEISQLASSNADVETYLPEEGTEPSVYYL
ncbi:MAG: 4Fe-4S dicluster domain-containing protein [Coriobacteriales bacterium]|jgi:Fe-S-cluster-containing dehydrogenase component